MIIFRRFFRRYLEIDYIGLDEETNRLLYFNPDGEVTSDDKSEFKLKSTILKKYIFISSIPTSKFLFILRYPSITLTGRIQDAHLYFIKKSLIDYAIDNNKS